MKPKLVAQFSMWKIVSSKPNDENVTFAATMSGYLCETQTVEQAKRQGSKQDNTTEHVLWSYNVQATSFGVWSTVGKVRHVSTVTLTQ